MSKSDTSHIGQYGFPIPTEEYLDAIEDAWDEPNCLRDDRIFDVSRKSAQDYLLGNMTGAEIINQFGEEIRQFCEEGQFSLV